MTTPAPTNPEQVCPCNCHGMERSGLNCEHCHGEVAAKPDRLGECAVHEDEHYKNDDCRGFQLFDADGNYAIPAPAPVDQPDELEYDLDTVLALLVAEDLDARSKLVEPISPDWANEHFDRAKARVQQIIAREREAAYKRGRDDEHWECDPRHISAALTKGEETSHGE